MLALTLGLIIGAGARLAPVPAALQRRPAGSGRPADPHRAGPRGGPLPAVRSMSAAALAREVHRRLERSAGQVSKLGAFVYHWSLPPLETCPGATAACRLDCYAIELGVRRGARIRAAWARCLELATDPRFGAALSAALARLWPGLLRIHVAGDFGTAGYLMAWAGALRDNPHVRPFAFTRSWRVPALLRTIAVIGWPRWLLASTDLETGPAPALMREARMVPERMWSIRTGAARPARGACPEQVVQGATCATCGRCPGARLDADGAPVPVRWPDRVPILFYMHGRRYRRRPGEEWRHGSV